MLNNLLLRGQAYCAKIAVRPFEWHNLNPPSGRPREQSTDFFVLHLEHSDELSATYISRMEQIVGKVLSSRQFAVVDIREALPRSPDYPYSGFDAICATSSGNPQDLLQICSAIFAAWGNEDVSGDRVFQPVPPSRQHDVVRTWSRDYRQPKPLRRIPSSLPVAGTRGETSARGNPVDRIPVSVRRT